MDWSKIKTIFILTFLVLNIYLIYEFFKLKDASQLEYSTETSVEARLKADEIEYVELPKNNQKDMYLSAKPKTFTDEELEGESKLAGQRVKISEGTTIESVLEKPFPINDKPDQAELNAFIKSHVLHGEQYRYWGKKDNLITYYQQKDEKLFYKNPSGELTLILNEDHNIVSYRQTLLDEIEKLSEEDKMIQPLKVIETLYENGSLRPKSKITKVETGYYTLINTSTSQVLTPVWRFIINNKENLFVHGFEGQVIQLNNEDKTMVE